MNRKQIFQSTQFLKCLIINSIYQLCTPLHIVEDKTHHYKTVLFISGIFFLLKYINIYQIELMI